MIDLTEAFLKDSKVDGMWYIPRPHFKNSKSFVYDYNGCPICGTPMIDDSETVHNGLGSVPITHDVWCVNPYCYSYGECNSGADLVCYLGDRDHGPQVYYDEIERLSKKLPQRHKYPFFLHRYKNKVQDGGIDREVDEW